MYRKEKRTKTSLDGEVEIIETEERSSSGLLEFCGAIIAISFSILVVTLVLQNHDSHNRGLDRTINQFEKRM